MFHLKIVAVGQMKEPLASVVETEYPLSPNFSFNLDATIDDVTVPEPHTDKMFTAAIRFLLSFSRRSDTPKCL